MKIYQDYDKGDTRTYEGRWVKKDSLLIEAVGNIDELNSFVGLAISHIEDENTKTVLKKIQRDLFTIGSDLSKSFRKEDPSLIEPKKDVPRITEEHIKEIEKWAEDTNAELPDIRAFILPGGAHSAALLHVCRSVTRRAERRLVALSHEEEINADIMKYLNRLSDFLFALARSENKRAGKKEEEWH